MNERMGGTYLRAWRPFPRRALDIVCENVSAAPGAIHLHEEMKVILPRVPLRVTDATGQAVSFDHSAVGLINATELHALMPLCSAECQFRVLLIAPETILGIAQKHCSWPHDCTPWFYHRVMIDDRMVFELNSVLDDFERPMVSSCCENRLVDCCARLIMAHAAPPPPPPCATPRNRWGARRVRDFLQAHVSQAVSIDQLARIAGLSKYYLLRAFAGEYGMSPHAYQALLRLARARKLLARGVTPSTVAYESGFADQSHLTRRMKSTFGVTPAAYARQFTDPMPAVAAVNTQRRPATVASAA